MAEDDLQKYNRQVLLTSTSNVPTSYNIYTEYPYYYPYSPQPITSGIIQYYYTYPQQNKKKITILINDSKIKITIEYDSDTDEITINANDENKQ